jgi:hypothetical protein
MQMQQEQTQMKGNPKQNFKTEDSDNANEDEWISKKMESLRRLHPNLSMDKIRALAQSYYERRRENFYNQYITSHKKSMWHYILKNSVHCQLIIQSFCIHLRERNPGLGRDKWPVARAQRG